MKITEYRLRMQQVETHRNPFTEGYLLGFVGANITSRTDFTVQVLQSMLDLVLDFVRAAGSVDVDVKRHQTNAYHVTFSEVQVHFR
jgi:hypothetical protein